MAGLVLFPVYSPTTLEKAFPMLEINPLVSLIKNLQERSDVLRGYL